MKISQLVLSTILASLLALEGWTLVEIINIKVKVAVIESRLGIAIAKQ